MAITIERTQVLHYRLAGHHLAQRLGPGSLVEAAAACGIQNTPPGTAELALAARVSGLMLADFDRAVRLDKSLLQAISLRASPFFFPTVDAAVFTQALLPDDEAALRFQLHNFTKVFDAAGVSATEAFAISIQAASEVLDGQILTRGELSSQVSRRLPPAVVPRCEPCGVNHLPETQFRLLGWTGLVSFAPKGGKVASFMRTDQWLSTPLPSVDKRAARAELVRRYLNCYGPSTPVHFGEWAGISPTEADRAWQIVEAELTEVFFGSKKTWLLARDLDLLNAPPQPVGVRFLPPYDPYLALRDRTTLLPDKKWHPKVWQTLGNPGVVLLNGEVVGTWRPQKKGKRLLLTVASFESVSPSDRAELEVEAAILAPFKGCELVELTFVEAGLS